jgi:hypothetical protein
VAELRGYTDQLLRQPEDPDQCFQLAGCRSW